MYSCLIVDGRFIVDFEEAQQQQQKMLQQQQPIKSNGNNGDWNKKVLQLCGIEMMNCDINEIFSLILGQSSMARSICAVEFEQLNDFNTN